MTLWVPPSARRREAEFADMDRAEVMAQAVHDHLEHWTREAKRIDERLVVAWYGPNADVVGVIPERYHFILLNPPPSPPDIIPITGPDGEYRPLDSSIFDLLRRSDLWDERVQRDRRRVQEEITRAAERARAREREERQEELRDRANAAWRTSVSMTDAAPWSQNASGTARRGANSGRKAA